MTPGASPAPAPGPQGQPPIGSSPATGPTPNAGNLVKGNQVIGAALKLMAMGIALVGPQSEIGQATLKAMQDIGKKLPPGATTEAGEKNAMSEAQLNQQRMGPAMAMLKQQAGGGGGAPPGAPGQAQPPMAA
jgi:hypothetical protein